MASESTGKGFSPLRPLPISDANHKSRLLPVLLSNWLEIGGFGDPLQLRMPIANPGCYLSFCPTGCKAEVPTAPSLGSTDLLKLLTEFRKLIHSLDYGLIINGYNSGTARGKRCIGEDMKKGCGASMPSPGVPLSLHLYVFTNWEAV